MKAEAAPRLLSIGRICRDELLELEAWPAPDTKTHIIGRLTSLGGNAARAAVCAARLGARVSLAGRVGDDPAGRFCRERLGMAGVDTELVNIIPGGQTPCSHVLVCGAARTVLAETNRLEPLRMSAALADAAQAADIILLDPAAAHLATALKACSRAPLVYDHEPAAYAQAGIFELADYCVPGRAGLDGALGTREAVAALARTVAGQLVVTLAKRGPAFLKPDGSAGLPRRRSRYAIRPARATTSTRPWPWP